MSTPQIQAEVPVGNPIDLMEQIAVQNEWLFDRAGEDEMHLSFPGQTEDHHLSFSWRNNVETLQLSAQLEIKVPKQKRAEIASLINIVNEQLWLGHFELWSGNGTLVFRHAALLEGDEEASLSTEQADALIDAAAGELDRFYPVFQFVLWGGKTPVEAIAAAMVETQGEA